MGVQSSLPVSLIDQVPQAGVLADGDTGEADIHFPAGGMINDSVAIEAAVGPHRELQCCNGLPAVAHPPFRTVLTETKWAAPRAVLARRSSRRRERQHLAGAGGNLGQQRVIPSRAGA